MRLTSFAIILTSFWISTAAWGQGAGGGGGSSGSAGGAGSGSAGGTSAGAPALGGTSTPGSSFNSGSAPSGGVQPNSPTSVPGSGALPTQSIPGTGLSPNAGAGSGAVPPGTPAGVTGNSTPPNMVPDVTTSETAAGGNRDMTRSSGSAGGRTDAGSNYRGTPPVDAAPANPESPQEGDPSEATGSPEDDLNVQGVPYWQNPNIRWRYVWFKGQWWYWMPDSSWRIWNGADWMSEAEFDEAARTFTMDRNSRANAVENRAYRRY